AESGWLRFQARALHASDGTGERTIGVVQDVSEARRAWRTMQAFNEELAQAVDARTRDLRESVADLDAFNYSVAHDLRAPVRAVIAFTNMLLEDHGGALPPAARDSLERVARAGNHMARLIDALLGLARVTRAPLTRQPVDLSSMADEIARALQDEAPERQVRFDVQRGLTAMADPDLVRIVLGNLLRNAWKFTSRHATATIGFGAVARADGTEFFVRDDGAGFINEGADKLFHLFYRMHHASEFEGIGIGLTMVQRIVQRHGGRVRAEGEPERGATFYFTLG
ncbi:MAG: histidine kinase, partial [Burkholderiales bacterium]|nr:histidine kinase [Burkholderiales bacterium]